MEISKKRSIMNALILSQFSYCPLILMFQSRKLNHRINKIHERALRIVYNDHQFTFEEFVERDNSFTIHGRNLQKLPTEMFKVNNGLSVQLVSENFDFARSDQKSSALSCSFLYYKTPFTSNVNTGSSTK